jgi:hypothetical protein
VTANTCSAMLFEGWDFNSTTTKINWNSRMYFLRAVAGYDLLEKNITKTYNTNFIWSHCYPSLWNIRKMGMNILEGWAFQARVKVQVSMKLLVFSFPATPSHKWYHFPLIPRNKGLQCIRKTQELHIQCNTQSYMYYIKLRKLNLLWLNCPVTAKAVGFTAGPIDGCVSWAMRALWFGNWRD